MTTRAVHVVVDSANPPRLARFWADALGWELDDEDPAEAVIVPSGFHYPETTALPLVFVPVPEAKTVKNRVHFDIATMSAQDQHAQIERLLSLGAVKADIGQGDVPWEVLADPEGNEFCVLEPRPVYLDTGRVAAVVVDSEDPAGLAAFWSDAAGWTVRESEPDFVSLRSPADEGPYLEFLRTRDAKTVKNRIHVDVAPLRDGDSLTEADQLRQAGARPADVGQGEASWVVLGDPEGNEFCVLSPR
jgi:predicted enzyme related to lactoylglutathione lyase